MCVVSMVGDHYNNKWKDQWPPDWWKQNNTTNPLPYTGNTKYTPLVSQEEFDALKKEVLEMKALLIRALEYDKKNNEPNCEMEEKVALLKKVAEWVGVSLEDVFGKNK